MPNDKRAPSKPSLIRVAHWVVMHRDLSRPLPNLHPPERGFELHTVTEADDPVMELFSVSRRRFARRAFKRGDEAIVAVLDGRAAGYVWVATSSHVDPNTGIRLLLHGDAAWGYDLWVDPEHRQTGLARYLANQMIRQAREGGSSHFLAAAHVGNRPSLAVFRMVGLRPIQDCWSVQVKERWGVQVWASPRGMPCHWRRPSIEGQLETMRDRSAALRPRRARHQSNVEEAR